MRPPLVCFKTHVKKEDKRIKDEELDSWIRSLNILEELNIKIDARIIFCVNNWDKNYYNGDQGIIEDILYEEEKIYVSIIKNNGMKILLEPYTLFMEELEQSGKDFVVNILASVTQFPIKLAYAITIHKSQGMSIEKLVCDIDHIFENGQLYVALSRATNPNTLKIYSTKKINFGFYFANILKIDSNVIEFYKKHNFLDLEIQEQII